jgi:hypothetical protein
VEVRGGYTAAGEDISETTRKGRFNLYGVTSPAYQAVLSGDIDGDNTLNSGNSYHVVLGVNIAANSGTVMDGLTISGGYSNHTVDTGNITVDTRTIQQGGGGGMANYYSSPVLSNINFTANTAGNGGGIVNESYSSPIMTNITMTGNTATFQAGAIYNSYSSPVLTNVVISNNTSPDIGGFFDSNYSGSILTNVLITGNNATTGPIGGIFIFDWCKTILTNVIVAGNSAAGIAGGINIRNSDPVLTNVVVTGNVSTADGGGINVEYESDPVLTNVTIAGNYAVGSGGGFYLREEYWPTTYPSYPLIKNSIIHGNTAGTSGTENVINPFTPSTVNIEHSIVEGSVASGFWTTNGITDGGNNLDTDPSFSTPDPASAGSPKTGGNYHIQAASAADAALYPVDASGNWNTASPAYTAIFAAVTDTALREQIRLALQKDAAGNPRFNGALDMGAYEY